MEVTFHNSSLGYTIIDQLDACFFDGSRKKQRKIQMVKMVFICPVSDGWY